VVELVLIRHAAPEVDPDLSPRLWRLSHEGKGGAGRLAVRLRGLGLRQIVSSPELKAWETARILAAALDLPLDTAAGLHEHDRRGVPFTTPEAFQAQLAEFFERPQEPVFGRETAKAAGKRFGQALGQVMGRFPGDSIGVVSHGTVISLFVAGQAGMAPYPFWRKLGLPAAVRLSLPELNLLEVIESV
jgi:broad specificity phosphatase PhoE